MAKVGFVDERGCTGGVVRGGEVSPYFVALALVLPADAIDAAEASFLAWRRRYWPKSTHDRSDREVLKDEVKGSVQLRDYRRARRKADRGLYRHGAERVARIEKSIQSLCDRMQLLDAELFVQALIKREGPQPDRRALARETYVRLGHRLDLRARAEGGPMALVLDHRSQRDERDETLVALQALAAEEGEGIGPSIDEVDSRTSGLVQAADLLVSCCAAPALQRDFRDDLVPTAWVDPAHRRLGELLRGPFGRLCPRGNAEVRFQGMDEDGRWHIASGG